jgi:hypothetical protein
MIRQKLSILFVLVCLLMTGFIPVSANAPARLLPAATSGNLIVNGNAETGPGSSDGSVVPVPGWTPQGNFTVVQYGASGGFPDSNSPGPADRGVNFFAGGPDNPASSATQTIDLSSYAAAIDTGNQTYTLSGYLGGWSSQTDNATLTIDFRDSANQLLGTATIGPVTNDERGSQTALFYRTINGLVPALSREVDVTLQMTRYDGTYNDGYADNLFLGLVSSSGGVISGKVYNDNATAGNEVKGAFIQACLTGDGCQMTTSNSDGSYWFINLAAGQYLLRAFPPGGNDRLIGLLGPLTLLDNSTLLGQNIILLQPTSLPQGTTITPTLTTSNGVPVVYWHDALTLTTTGCSGGTASYQVFQQGNVIRSGSLVESPAGTYTAAIASLYPQHGDARVVITLQCAGEEPTQITFNIWIDPSGVVVDTNGIPVPDATVTLYRADMISGPFDIVVSGSGVMSPGNRDNPMQTDTAGLFGWDVIAGYYTVRAEKSGCVSANDHLQPYAQTDVLTIPPAVTNLRLVLYCGEIVKVHIYLPIMLH